LQDLRIWTGRDVALQLGPIVSSGQIICLHIELVWVAGIEDMKPYAAFRRYI
jgi:hypothetical protein